MNNELCLRLCCFCICQHMPCWQLPCAVIPPPPPACTAYCLHCVLPQVSHVSLDPLRRDQLAVLPLHRFRAAIVLADEGWGAGDSGEAGKQAQMQMQQQQQAMASPGDVIDQPSVLRQDALMVMVQVGLQRFRVQGFRTQDGVLLLKCCLWIRQRQHLCMCVLARERAHGVQQQRSRGKTQIPTCVFVKPNCWGLKRFLLGADGCCVC